MTIPAAIVRPAALGRCAHCHRPKPDSWITLVCRRCLRRGFGAR